VLPGAEALTALLDECVTIIAERSVLAITSKIVALCEGRVVALDDANRMQLIRREAEWYYEEDEATSGYNFTIKQNTLIPASGIDLSNGDGHYVLWPADAGKTAQAVWRYLRERFGVRETGVIITDSTACVSRWGTLGIALGHCGFRAVKDYNGKPDLFGRPLTITQANVCGGLAAAAALAMGEGAEQTPLAVIEDLQMVEFCEPGTPQHPYYLSPLDDDLFRVFFRNVKWRRGGQP
jgi:F420-0:gamma-glutamyl ligase